MDKFAEPSWGNRFDLALKKQKQRKDEYRQRDEARRREENQRFYEEVRRERGAVVGQRGGEQPTRARGRRAVSSRATFSRATSSSAGCGGARGVLRRRGRRAAAGARGGGGVGAAPQGGRFTAPHACAFEMQLNLSSSASCQLFITLELVGAVDNYSAFAPQRTRQARRRTWTWRRQGRQCRI